MKKRIILLKDNVVDNVIVVDDASDWVVPRGYTSLEYAESIHGASPGYIYDPLTSTFSPPVDTRSYIELREASYPKIGDQLDAVLKQFQALKQAEAIVLEPELDKIVTDWQAVKTLYPKPIEELSK